MAKKNLNLNLNENWHTISLALFVLIVSIVIGHISFSFKEKFISAPANGYITKGDVKNTKPMYEAIQNDPKDAYKNMFDSRIPTFLNHPCSPDCCKDSMALTCSRGCICLNEADKKALKKH
jgi:hypothetical protein